MQRRRVTIRLVVADLDESGSRAASAPRARGEFAPRSAREPPGRRPRLRRSAGRFGITRTAPGVRCGVATSASGVPAAIRDEHGARRKSPRRAAPPSRPVAGLTASVEVRADARRSPVVPVTRTPCSSRAHRDRRSARRTRRWRPGDARAENPARNASPMKRRRCPIARCFLADATRAALRRSRARPQRRPRPPRRTRSRRSSLESPRGRARGPARAAAEDRPHLFRVSDERSTVHQPGDRACGGGSRPRTGPGAFRRSVLRGLPPQ